MNRQGFAEQVISTCLESQGIVPFDLKACFQNILFVPTSYSCYWLLVAKSVCYMLLLAIAKVCSRCYMSQFVAGTRKPWVVHVEPLQGMEQLFKDLFEEFQVADGCTEKTVTVMAPKNLF
jgi:hypothetical protein